ncbi:MAG: LysM peptidoglycan-binding domain-containing protein [Microbacterium sp.]|uniref:LysM peptidoglycan-binding domain-containing protein n=1 Tax=Microbacterium sp. TaxID=51671 RepID=UPI001E0BCA48|nr:LysM peptidoglycan-binding domain-containing protein [Microbacterium sp.]MBW8763073.1 LysM peptidoglycan-binding domain-containing protein [Microbacterium sp.]
MRLNTAARRTRYLQIGMPAAVIGTLTGSMAVVPATADVAPVHSEIRSTPALRVVPASVPTAYVVQPGDTISAIAERHGLRTADVLAWNGLTWRSVIYPGQTLSLAGTSAPATVPAAAQTHVVVAGDTVYGIAQKYGTSVDAVLAANALTRASVIYPGQSLLVSGAAAAAPAVAPATAPAAVTTSAAGAQTHAVVAGDTLFGIAQKYGTTTASLYAWNAMTAQSIIYPGQSIVVSAPPVQPGGQLSATLDAEQAANAALIITIGRQLGVSDRGLAIALATAMVESGLRNLDHGDRDSLGLFQQRPSTGWGAAEQILDADRSTRAFFGGQSDPNGQITRGLLDVAGWESLPFTVAAQTVQISAYPDKYGQWETQAYQWLALHG